MRQRLALARALLVEPDLLVLDEPTAHLDPETRDAVLDDLLAATTGHTMILITHDLSGLDRFDQIVVMVGGRVVRRGTPAQLSALPGGCRADRPSQSGHRDDPALCSR
jgi:ATP-binding cassette subfamily C protein CydC